MKQIKKLLDFLQRLTEYALFAMVAAMVLIVFAQVVFRFALRASLPWSEEAARYIMVWISLLGASIGIRNKGHIGVEALILLFPPFLKKIAAVFATLVASAFFGSMIFYGLKVLKVVSAQESPAMEISMAVPYSSMIVGGVLMLLYSLEELVLLLCPRAAGSGGGTAP